jgi:hypothetical protein
LAAGNVTGTNCDEGLGSLAARAAASSFSMKISASMAVLHGFAPYSLDDGGRIAVQIVGGPRKPTPRITGTQSQISVSAECGHL